MKWDQITEGFLELSVRERVLILCAVVAGILFLGIQLVITPIMNEKSALQDQRLQNNTMLADLATEQTEILGRLANNPNDRLSDEKQRLQTELSDLKDSLATKVATLLTPRETQTLLRSLLDDYKGLELVSAKNLSPKTIKVNANDLQEPADEEITAKLYEHGFEMTLTGTYFQTKSFLERLESLEGFYWERIDYEVLEYPKAQIVLGISTLSIDEAWIGG